MKSWLHVTSGQGPDECELAVPKVVEAITHEAANLGVLVEELETVAGRRAGTLRSVLLALEGERIPDLTRRWVGTIQWIAFSPYRPHHRRKNWFVGVEALDPPERNRLSEKDLRFETMRSAGPGGQHVNKTESAVRVIHVPSGKSTVAREFRSQALNRRLATARLLHLLKANNEEKRKTVVRQKWAQHGELERGNPVRVFAGPDFKPKK